MEERINQATGLEELEQVVGYYQDTLDAHRARFQEFGRLALIFERDLQTAISTYDELATREPAADLEELKEAAHVVRVRFGIWATNCL